MANWVSASPTNSSVVLNVRFLSWPLDMLNIALPSLRDWHFLQISTRGLPAQENRLPRNSARLECPSEWLHCTPDPIVKLCQAYRLNTYLLWKCLDRMYRRGVAQVQLCRCLVCSLQDKVCLMVEMKFYITDSSPFPVCAVLANNRYIPIKCTSQWIGLHCGTFA